MNKENREKPEETRNTSTSDLPDNAHDEERMQSETTIIDLPEVKDIPGQEHVRPAPLGELADVTISSSDEEGEGLFDDEDGNDQFAGQENKNPSADLIRGTVTGSSADVSREEKSLLRKADQDMPGGDDEGLRDAQLDSVDEEGTPLNEKGFGVGRDLDVPGAEEDDANENIGEEDEENNQYSRGGVENDNMTEGTP